MTVESMVGPFAISDIERLALQLVEIQFDLFLGS